jgi:hypothetical protein
VTFHRVTRLALLATTVVALSGATQNGVDPRLQTRLDPEARRLVVAIVDSARRDSLPVEPLIRRALEGASKGAVSGMIAKVVSGYAHDLRRARQALGPTSSNDEVVAAANALKAGVDIQQLERLRQLRAGHRYALSLDVMTALVGQGVDPDVVAGSIVNLLLASATDEQIARFQQDVVRDMSFGTPGATAVTARGEVLEKQLLVFASDSGGPGARLPSGRGAAISTPSAVGPQITTSIDKSGEGTPPPAPRGKPRKRP